MPPIVGPFIALIRKLAPRTQDYRSSPYREMVEFFTAALDARPNSGGLLLWAAGHEHNLQVLAGKASDYILISGAAAQVVPVTHGDETLFAHSRPGFMVLDFLNPNRVLLRIIEVDGKPAFTAWLQSDGLKHAGTSRY